MSKLTLSVDKTVISRAKRYAQERGVSVSQMVETYLSAVSKPSASDMRATPVLDSVRGILRVASIRDARQEYRKHLEKKYR